MRKHTAWPSFFFTVLAVLAAVFVRTSLAGEFFEKNGVALRGYDPVAYFVHKRPLKGLAQHTQLPRFDLSLCIQGQSRQLHRRPG
ncbi:MAG: hypothetical protein ACKVQU_03715 [Burkholderiales bacterium]